MTRTDPLLVRYSVDASSVTRRQVLEFERAWWCDVKPVVQSETVAVERALLTYVDELGGAAPLGVGDLIDFRSGAFSVLDWQTATVSRGSPADVAFGLSSGTQPVGRSIVADTRILLRGLLYYPGLAVARASLDHRFVGPQFLDVIARFAADGVALLDDLPSEPSLAIALTGGVVDNLRGATLSLLVASLESRSLDQLGELSDVARAAVRWMRVFFSGSATFEDLRRGAQELLGAFDRCIGGCLTSPGFALALSSSPAWAWRREADSALICYLAARLATRSAPDDQSGPQAIAGVARSGIEMAFMLSEVSATRTGANAQVLLSRLGTTPGIGWVLASSSRPPPPSKCAVVLCDDSSASGATLHGASRSLAALGCTVRQVVLALGPECGRGAPGTGPLTNPLLYGSHIVGMPRRSPLERRATRKPRGSDVPVVLDKEKERLAAYLSADDPTRPARALVDGATG